MSPEEAERMIGETGDAALIGPLIASLAPATPGVIYRSQDILDGIGHELLATAFTYLAFEHVLNEPEGGQTSEWVSTTDTLEEMRLFTELSPQTLDIGSDHAAASAVIAGLRPEILRKVLGRLVDRAGGLIILQPDTFLELRGKSPGLMMSIGQDVIAPGRSFAFAAHVLMAGKPHRVHLLRALCARQGGPVPGNGKAISDFCISPGPDMVMEDTANEQGFST